MKRTYEIRTYKHSITGEKMESIRCLVCKKISHNSNDIAAAYCGFCHKFHADMERELALKEKGSGLPL